MTLVNVLDEILAERIRELEIPGYGDDEVRFLAGVVRRANPTHVFEWGTNRGSSARVFYESGVALGYPLEVHTTELSLDEAYRDRDHPGEDVGLFVRDVPVVLHTGDGLRVTLDLLGSLRPERPLFFVDGYHSYDQVRLELMMLSYSHAPVVLHDSVHLVGVRDAIADFLFSPRGHEFEREDLASEAGMTALWPK